MSNNLDPFYIKQDIYRKQHELFVAEMKAGHGTMHTHNPDLNKWKARDLREDIAVLRAKLEVIEQLKNK